MHDDGIGYLHLTDSAGFGRWLNDPSGPKTVAYHVGDLDQDRGMCRDLDRRACAALAAAEAVRPAIHLTQKRLADHQAVYLATKSLGRTGVY